MPGYGLPEEILPEDGGGGYVPPPQTGSGDWAELAVFPGGETPFKSCGFSGFNTTQILDLNGTYTVSSADEDTIELSDPESDNPDWGDLTEETAYSNAIISTALDRWIGPFRVELADIDVVSLNFIATAGLYTITGKKGKQTGITVSVQAEVQPLDSAGDPLGAAIYQNKALTGSAKEKDLLGETLQVAVPTASGADIRVKRITNHPIDFEGTIVDEVKWQAGYGLATVDVDDFGDVTTVIAKTVATRAATAAKERKLNCQAIRMIPLRDGDEFTEDLYATERVDEIIAAIALDPVIGNQSVDNIDVPQIYDTIAEAEAYFGSDKAVKFGHTFDDDNVSFENTLAVVTQACFCAAYRQGSTIRLTFERARDDSVLLFNHRNILPRTQERTVRFGVFDDHDGIEATWVDPKDGAKVILHIPPDRSAVSARKIELTGVNSPELAFWQAYRAWHKLKFQSTSLKQTCLQEAALVIPGDRVLVTDQLRPPGFEGEVLAKDGLVLSLSQPTDFDPGEDYTIFLQHSNATVEAIEVGPFVPGVDEAEDRYRVTLAQEPMFDLALDEGLYAYPTYEIIRNVDGRSRAFLVTEREPMSNFTESLEAMNYSPLYYLTDALVLWLPFDDGSVRVLSPTGIGASLIGSADIVSDPDRGLVYQCAAGDGGIDVGEVTAPAEYTKAAWVLYTPGEAGEVIGSTADERFGIEAGGNVRGGHAADLLSHAFPSDGEWHHIALTYDGADMVLYLDGEAVASGATARGTIGDVELVDGFDSSFDEIILLATALGAPAVRALFRSSRRI